MAPTTLRQNPSKDDDSWRFTVPQDALLPPRNAKDPLLYGKLIKFTADAITLDMQRLPNNRILQTDDRSKFILLSCGDLRFPETPIKVTGDYISRLLKAGLFLNGVRYRFYHHSNSQLRSRSCFLRVANSDAELDDRIYRMGDFQKIMSAAKRAKRIGLLFSEAQLDLNLDPKLVKDIEDIKSGDELFSDGCGLISKYLAIELAKRKKIIFRGVRYTPCVFQIRYLGYKGVLMLHPKLDELRRTNPEQNNHLVHFRRSMKKFSTTQNTTFSVVDHSAPYSFGRLNNDIIVLLSSLGITDDALLAKQDAYFQWIRDAATDPVVALDFLSSLNAYGLAERVLLDGLDDPRVAAAVRSLQLKEIGSFKNDRNKDRSRMIVKKSRLIFGVCDPFGVLKEGEVHIRITTARKGPSTPIHADVLVVRNPCLHPGDCLKLRAVHRPELSHLVDCIVFAGVARPGHQAAPSMSSGGDLDGDKYFVCWDPDLVPTTISESYDYPPNREPSPKAVTRTDLANYFASYNSAGLARVAALHAKWVRGSPLGALSPECQELNALHSQSVDGASVKIPERLTTPPAPPGGDEAFIINRLASAARRFAEEFTQAHRTPVTLAPDDPNVGQQLLLRLLQSAQNSLSEYELFTLAFGLSRRLGMSRNEFIPYLGYLDFGALTTPQKYAVALALDLDDRDRYPFVWNSLIRSDILTPGDLYARSLNQPFSLQRLYSSKVNGLGSFFFYLRMAINDFTRKLLVLKTDDRFAVGIFMRGELPWDEDPEVNENVVVCSFMDKTSSNFSGYRPCTSGYRLHCSDTNFQLYDKNRGNTFIFMTRPPAASGAELAVSIAVQKISARVQRQVGRINRTPVTAIELHVVSNRDRIAHQLFDMWFEHVPTENRVRRFERQAAPYHLNDVKDIPEADWRDAGKYPISLVAAFHPRLRADDFEQHLNELNPFQFDEAMQFSLKYHLEDETFWMFNHIISALPLRRAEVVKWMDAYPPLVFSLLKAYPPNDGCLLPDETSPVAIPILYNLIRSSNTLRLAVLVALQKISATVAALPLTTYFDLLWLAACSVRSQELVQEVLLVLNDCRLAFGDDSDVARRYGEKHALAIAFDRAEEAFEECPCDEDGKPKRQRTAPAHTRLSPVDGEALYVRAPIRIDAKSAVRLHSHVRLQAASKPDNRWIESIVMDGVVVQAMKGELKIELMHPPPPEMEAMDWNLYNAGIIATSKAMMEALLRLLEDREICCRYYSLITGTTPETPLALASAPTSPIPEIYANLNQSQITAVESTTNPLCLVWGPPGTGKTTVVVRILRRLLSLGEETKILMTASTHNAVDNVLERFIEMNKEAKILEESQILRVATDVGKVNPALRSFTIDDRVGGDMNENNKLFKKAQERLKAAVLVFSTYSGAGLGILRKVDFDTALIDEASQITEPGALIPLVKGTRQAILVGDHVQLRPTVKPMGKVLKFDVSLLERLYTSEDVARMEKTMLDIQYRFPKELAEFPSREFYDGRLRTGISNNVLNILDRCEFPWPRHSGSNTPIPTVFLQCSAEEDMGGRSKKNDGQVEVVKRILPMLETTKSVDGAERPALSVAVLSPYSKQVTELKRIHSQSFTIDSFQGRESDIIIFSSVRSNVERDIGFVDDARRLNVMWTRARLALIIIGDRATMASNDLWKRALDTCSEVILPAVET